MTSTAIPKMLNFHGAAQTAGECLRVRAWTLGAHAQARAAAVQRAGLGPAGWAPRSASPRA